MSAPHYRVMHRLEEKGFQAYLVGGSVRDRILGRASKDYDVTTDALPEQVRAIFAHTIPVGAKFGVTVVVEDDTQIEVATYRADGAYTDGRRPDEVKYSLSAKDDVMRRDFTMNGLLLKSDASVFDDGGVVDHVGGLDDIKNRLIRAIGSPNVRFAEDALRMLRAVRFAAQLGFEIEEDTFQAMRNNARLLDVISRERVAAELFKMFSAPFPLKGLIPFITSGLYRYALPTGEYDFATHVDLLHMIQRFGMFTANKDAMLGMGMFFADITPHVGAHTAQYLKLSNEQARELDHMNSHVLAFQQHLKGAYPLPEAALKRACREPGIQLALEIMTQNEVMGKTNLGMEAVMEFVLELKAYTPEDIKPAPLVTGKDLIAAGIPPSPIFSSVLYDIESAQLNGVFTTREQGMEFVRARVYQDDKQKWVYSGLTNQEFRETQ